MIQFEKVRAAFAPKRLDDLQGDACADVGKVATFSAGWVIDYGPYEGQFAMIPERAAGFDFAWCPACDLEIVG